MIGLVLVLPNFDVRQPENLGVVYALAAAVLLALSGHIMRRVYLLYPAGRTANGILVIEYAAMALALSPFLIASPVTFAALGTFRVGGLLLLLGLVFSGLHRVLVSASSGRVTYGKASLIHALDPFVATALAWPCLGQTPSLRVLGGTFVITLAALGATYVQIVGPATFFRPVRWN
jgi:drug/metabolite transporter (DMT)-like permease